MPVLYRITISDLFSFNRHVLRRVDAQFAALSAVAFEHGYNNVVAYGDLLADFTSDYEQEESLSKILMMPG
jgi:hypothetical protein